MKKVLTLTIALLMAVALVACGGKTDPPATEKEEPAASVDSGASQQETPDEAEDAGEVMDGELSTPDGKEWPDNEFTQKVPALPFTIEGFPDNGSDKFGVNFSSATMESGMEYGTSLQDSGFNENVRGTLTPGENEPYTLYASNADGWAVEYECGVYGFGSLYITKP